MNEFRRILCPTDFSPTSSAALEHATAMARAFGAELLLVHVVPEMNYPLRSFGMAAVLPDARRELQAKAGETLRALAGKIRSDVAVRTVVADGEVHAAILQCAKLESADMIVMGTHGHTGLKHAMLGSTAERVVRLAECPVLTVRSR
jgi:nucleotide-binding universal stress UspA family protein